MLRSFCRSIAPVRPSLASLAGRKVPQPCRPPFHSLDPTEFRQHRSGAGEMNAEHIQIHFKLRDGSRKTVSVPSGTSVLEAAHLNEIDLEGACEASLACSTCHVILPQDVYDQMPEPSEKEEDLLDLAPCLTPSSRLGCQVIVDSTLKDVEIELPAVTLNFYVDGFVPTPH
mmetsp:Transcript_22168/g.51794  ORF Transcript_22168/g.51794 Transcript_22168/m.51794 type:complete len:171 (-) Transcript_22168:199-711(-)|eukprot:CAMPEP_0171074702 /NCGR_PEP_ID=MMETSP0766_2-20121228/12312_1 /TAXON_ID=439317 /ORGANISM="Gambierdiscus australes, Strain CAWD 149" /LENGTH=170 /DNA_ID=CAMNT_0011531513 /DNA_START=56 /DNA_END=568 /DNA_ORIENTATION=-